MGEKARVYLSLFFWFLTAFFILLNFNLSYKLEKMRDSSSELESKINLMRFWAEEIKNSKASRGNQDVLAVVDSAAKKYNIQLDSVRPVQNFFEITARGVDPVSVINFLSEIEKANSSTIVKLKLRKNFADENSNDVEMMLAP
jgi:hypothetical protein